jgi:putative tryptophan/tyrosine transport system substrate-binding protein
MEAVPEARRFAFLADPSFIPPAQLSALQNATRARGVEVAVFKARAPEQIAPMMDEAKAWGATALNVLSTPLFSFNRRIVIERAAALGLPAIYEWPEMAEEGGLIGYRARVPLVYRQLARLLVKVLRGVKPADIPVEELAKFDLVVNLKTACGGSERPPRRLRRGLFPRSKPGPSRGLGSRGGYSSSISI